MRKFGVEILYIPILVVLVEFIYWTTMDWLIFNDEALDSGLEIMYYSSAALVALGLTTLQTVIGHKIYDFLNYLILVLINTYLLFSVIQMYGVYCDDIKNLSSFYVSLNILIILSAGYLMIFKVIPRLRRAGIVWVAISTILSFIDFLFLFYGYELFYPGFWK